LSDFFGFGGSIGFKKYSTSISVCYNATSKYSCDRKGDTKSAFKAKISMEIEKIV